MSARREKRLRKLENKVAYMDGRVRELERRLLSLEELASHPVMILSAGDEKNKHPTFWEKMKTKLKLWKLKRTYMKPNMTTEEVQSAFNSWKTK